MALKILIVTILLFALVTFNSCDLNGSKCGGDYSFSGDNLFGFVILDKKTNENVFNVFTTNYNYDTVTVYNPDWKVALATSIGFDGAVALRFIDLQSDKDVVDQLISKRFYMYFNYQDIDTIDIDFKMTKGNCGHQIMEYFKVAYNDSVYVDKIVSRVPGASFLK